MSYGILCGCFSNLYKWSLTVFISLHLIFSLSVIFLKSIPVNTNVWSSETYGCHEAIHCTGSEPGLWCQAAGFDLTLRLASVWPWTSSLPPQGLNFLICKMVITITPTLWGLWWGVKWIYICEALRVLSDTKQYKYHLGTCADSVGEATLLG